MIKESECDLFRRWRACDSSVIQDGVVDESEFNTRRRPRIVFVLKEGSDFPDEQHYPGGLAAFLGNGAPGNGGHTWEPVKQWLEKLDGCTYVNRVDALKSIALINLKKTTGGTTTEAQDFKDALRDVRNIEFLAEQISYYDDEPTIFVCGGYVGGKSVKDYLIEALRTADKEHKLNIEFIEGVGTRWGRNSVAVEMCHPVAYKSDKREIFLQKVNTARTLFCPPRD